MIYNEKPENFIQDIEVVSCLVHCNNKILLLHRQDNKPEGNKWGLPGGKINKEDDCIEKAILREVKEETGLSINEEELNFHKTFFVSHPQCNFPYHYFSFNLKEMSDVVISEREHKTFIWVTLEEALNMPLVTDEDYCLKHFYGIK